MKSLIVLFILLVMTACTSSNKTYTRTVTLSDESIANSQQKLKNDSISGGDIMWAKMQKVPIPQLNQTKEEVIQLIKKSRIRIVSDTENSIIVLGSSRPSRSGGMKIKIDDPDHFEYRFENNLLISGPITIKLEKCPELTPMITIEPKGMNQKYINNYFLFSFDIGDVGRLENLKLIDSDSDEYMKKQALKAMAKWKFKPIVRNGKVVKVSGCKYRYVQSELEKSRESW